MQLSMKNKLYPTSHERQALSRHFGCARKVWNLILPWCWDVYEETGKTPSHFEMCKRLTALKQEREYLQEASTTALQHTLGNLAKAFAGLKAGRTRKPKFKSRFNRQSLGYPQKCKIQNNHVRIPKIGWIRFRGESDGSEWNGKTVTVSLDTDGTYWMSYNYEVELPPKTEPTDQDTIGIDLGIKDFVVTSDGRKINPEDAVHHFSATDHRLESRVRKYQRKMARQVKGSRRRRRTMKLLARAYSKLARFRRYMLHILSATLTKTHVVVENLHIKGMFRLRNLSPKLQRLGLGEFLRQLRYKAPLNGKYCLEVGRWFPSSKLCWDCGSINHDLTLADREWTCLCGAVHDRDWNAASNVKHEGLRMWAEQQLMDNYGAEGVPVPA